MWVCVSVYVHGHRQTDTHTHTHTMEYYSAIKKNETMPSATKWMDLEITIQSEVSRTEEDKYRSLSWGIWKDDINELIYKTEIDSQT